MDYLSIIPNASDQLSRRIREGNEAIDGLKKGKFNEKIVSTILKDKKDIIRIINVAKLALVEIEKSEGTNSSDYIKLQNHLIEYAEKVQILSGLIDSKEQNKLHKAVQKIQSALINFSTQPLSDKHEFAPQLMERRMSNSDLFSNIQEPQFEPEIQKGIIFSQQARVEKLHRLTETFLKDDAFAAKVKNVEKEWNHLIPQFKELKGAYQKHQENPDNLELKDHFLSLQDHLMEACSLLTEKYPDLGFDENTFISLYDFKTSLEGLEIQKQVILNQIVNKTFCLKQVEHFANVNKTQIIKHFQSEGLLSQWDKPINEEDIRVEVQFLSKGMEGHNGGKQPTKITFDIKGQSPPFTFVCKPRKAINDKAVIDTFKKINLTNQQAVPLPTYTIINPNNNEGWKDLDKMGEISIWEFIEGKNIREISKANSASVYVSKNTQLRNKLNRMDAILTAMNISDLHPENLIIGKRENKTVIIPIDLEVIGLGQKNSTWHKS